MFLEDTYFPLDYLNSITKEPEADLNQLSYESWWSDPIWTENQYSYIAEFQVDEPPMPTLNLSFWLSNNSQSGVYVSDVF